MEDLEELGAAEINRHTDATSRRRANHSHASSYLYSLLELQITPAVASWDHVAPWIAGE